MLCSQLGVHHPLFVHVDTLGASWMPPPFSSHIRFFTLYHHEYTLIVSLSLCPHPIFQQLDEGLWFQGEASQLPTYSLHQGLSW